MFVLFSDFGEETPEVTQDPAQLLKKKPKKQPKPAEVTEQKPAEEKPAEATGDVTAPAEATVTTAEPDPTVTTTETTTSTTTAETPVETTAPAEATTTTETTTAADTTTPTESTSVTEATPVETTPPESSVTEAPATPDNATVDSVTGDETAPSQDNLTEQILKDLENQAATTEKKPVKTQYVAPPNYENVGRGLVYNCTGQHWACVDGPSYKTCEENSSSTKFLKKQSECYPFNVYETQSGCEKMQNRMVSSSAKTGFCFEN